MPIFFEEIENSVYRITKCMRRGKVVEILGTINTNLEITPSPTLKKPLSEYYIRQIKKEFKKEVLVNS